jgi:hypothetical protein
VPLERIQYIRLIVYGAVAYLHICGGLSRFASNFLLKVLAIIALLAFELGRLMHDSPIRVEEL